MKYVIFTVNATALRFAADIDADIGYPKGPSTIIGRSRRALPPLFGRTQANDELFKHPARNEWAYPDSPAVVERRARVPLPSGAVSTDVTPDWGVPTLVQAQLE